MKKTLLSILLLILSYNLFSQQIPEHDDINEIQVSLSIAVLAFGLILILAVLLFLYKLGKGFGNITFKTLGIILILTASLFLIVAGYGHEQITPVIGLLGTIAGFIFGSTIGNDSK